MLGFGPGSRDGAPYTTGALGCATPAACAGLTWGTTFDPGENMGPEFRLPATFPRAAVAAVRREE